MLLEINDAQVRLGQQTFGPFTFCVRAGERLAVLGPSGAGKSTLLRTISAEHAVGSGQVYFDQQPLSTISLPLLSRRRAVLPQSYGVAFGLQTDLVIALGRVARQHDPQLSEIVRAAAQLASAEHLLGRLFNTLSGGEQARVQLARVFAQLWDVRDGLLLVDEPVASLDPGLQHQLLDAINAFARARGHALIAVLHDINQALSFDRLLLVQNGQMIGDLSATIDALPSLEKLYGVSLECVRNSRQQWVVTILRNNEQEWMNDEITQAI